MMITSRISKVYLYPAALHFSEEAAVVTTVLGSCVSVTMFHRKMKMGAICHGVLPKCKATTACRKVCVECFKYVDCSIHYMLKEFDRRGVPRRTIELKLFGGADILGSKTSNKIGAANIASALEVLGQEGLSVSAADVGDCFGRKLIFHTHTGDVYLKRFLSPNAKDSETISLKHRYTDFLKGKK